MENHRRGDSSISVFKAIRHLFNGSAMEPVLISSRLSMIRLHKNELETVVNEEREAAFTDYDDSEALPSITSRSLMLDSAEYGDNSFIHIMNEDEAPFNRPSVTCDNSWH